MNLLSWLAMRAPLCDIYMHIYIQIYMYINICTYIHEFIVLDVNEGSALLCVYNHNYT